MRVTLAESVQELLGGCLAVTQTGHTDNEITIAWRWRSIAIEKPKEGQRCIVWIDQSCDGPKKCVAHPWSFHSTFLYTWEDGLWGEFAETYQPPVVKWMPIPEVPDAK